ncbi:hypothetical protein HOLleu_38606 [Holothuria leucospilota]|uniref:Uncharacterized protein n=1 Tax=Holothuria leucospilota TaxID=206669 RepID=A0A9Q0YH77_HOLLE|nr:hypothetical protein HOLleu_38606 [Holothuria leucospilota]
MNLFCPLQVESIQRDLSETKEDNHHLHQTLEELSQTNIQLQTALNSLQGQLDSQRREHQLFTESSEMEKSDLNHQIELLQEKVGSTQAQLNSQKSLVNKRTQKEISSLRQAHLEVTSRVGDLSQKNNELHQKISELEGTVSKLKDRIKSQKSQMDSYRDLKEKNADLSKENAILNSRLRDFEGVKKNFITKNKEQTATISAFMKEVEQLQLELKELSHDQKGAVSKNDRDAKHRENRLHRLEKENASLRDRLHETELDKSDLEMKLAEVSSESEEISKHLQDADKWFQQKYSGLQQQLIDANKGKEVLKQTISEQAQELRKEKLKSNEQTQRAYEMIRASRQTLGKLAVQMEKDHIESKSQMHFLARRVQAEKDHSIYTEGKYKRMLVCTLLFLKLYLLFFVIFVPKSREVVLVQLVLAPLLTNSALPG